MTMTVRDTENPVNNARLINVTSISGCPVLRQPKFDWKAADKYQELFTFKEGVKNISITNNYNTQESKRVPIILSWLGQEGLRFVQTLNHIWQEKYRTSMIAKYVFFSTTVTGTF